MTWAERLMAARTEIARRRVVALACPMIPLGIAPGWEGTGQVLAYLNSQTPSHAVAILDLHAQLLDLVDAAFMLPRLDRPAPLTDALRAVIELYAPETADA